MVDSVHGIVRGLENYVDTAFFQGKSVIDTAYQPTIFVPLKDLGANVIVLDKSQEVVDSIPVEHPGVSGQVLDVFNESPSQKVDVIVSSHVLENVSNIDGHLESLCANCDYLLLDALVFDSDDNTAPMSPPYLQAKLEALGFQSVMPIDSCFDDGSSHFGWEANNDRNTREGHRRFFVCWRSDVPSPLKA